MEQNMLPKVLVVSTNAWRDNTGINTLIEFFRCWDADRIAQVYTKSTLPSTTVCNRFFSISENAVMKSLLKRKTVTGRRVYNQTDVAAPENESAEEEQKMYSSYKGGIRSFLAVCRELVWKFGKWRTDALDAFVQEFDPDVLYIPIYPTIYMGRIQKYIIKKTNKPVVSYLADDNYTYRSIKKNPIALLQRLILRKYVKFIVDHSEKVMVIAPKQKEEYDRIFGVDSVVMTKGLDYSNQEFTVKPVHKPIRLVYTGKLIIGRWKSLAAIAEALGEINRDETKMELHIYTTDTLTKEQETALNRNGSEVKGSLTLEEVRKVQQDADLLVFVESLEKKYKHTARLSFSTKVTDYLRSGKCIFAIGDKDIAPIDYFERYDSAVIATDYQQIGEKLKQLVEDTGRIQEYAKKAYHCGMEHHERSKMDQLLTETIVNAK